MYNGPKIPTEGIVFALDASSLRGVSGTGNTSYNGAPSAAKNIVNRGENVSTVNGTRLTNVNYYTAFAIDYPEGSYGGAAANRQGLTAGFNVTSGGKTYDSSRSLHLWVWNNDTNGWVPDSYFRGFRLAGHCYDNYSGAENGYLTEIGLFIEDYNRIKAAFPNCTYIVTGSHRADQYTSALRAILKDLGMPNGFIESDYIAAPEWILVGEPGLGTGNAYGWAYENYSTNPSQVAHLVFPLPLKGNRSSGFLFDGTNQYIDLPQNYQSGFTQATYMFVCKPSSLPSGTYRQLYIQESSTWIGLYSYGGAIFFGIDLHNGSGWFDNNGGFTTGARTTSTLVADRYYHVVYSWNGSNVSVYLNGSLEASVSTLQASNGRQNVTTLGAGSTHRNIGSRYSGGGNNWIGEINAVTMYNRALSATEVTQAYNAYRSRFNF